MAKVCEICGQKEETEKQDHYEILGLCESCLADRSSKQGE